MENQSCSNPRWLDVLVCGGRNYSDYDTLHEVLCDINVNKIIHGGARGADSLAGDWAKDLDVPCDVYPAQWDLYGKSAGYRRNVQMLKEGKPDLVIAFPGGNGTAMMVDIAKKAGVTVRIVKGI